MSKLLGTRITGAPANTRMDMPRKKGQDAKKGTLFVCVGFLFINGRPNFIDPEEYLDFRDMQWDKLSLESDLQRGVLPPGMLIRAEDGTKIGIVMGHYNYEQRVEVLGDLQAVNQAVKG